MTHWNDNQLPVELDAARQRDVADRVRQLEERLRAHEQTLASLFVLLPTLSGRTAPTNEAELAETRRVLRALFPWAMTAEPDTPSSGALP